MSRGCDTETGPAGAGFAVTGPANHRRISHRQPYPSDLTNTAWSRIRLHIVPPPKRPGGRPCPEWRWRDYLDAILNVNRTGCAWRCLPHDHAVSWSAAHKHFMRWAKDGTWDRILDALRATVRVQVGRDPRPTAGLIDSCSINGSTVPGSRDLDGANKVNGIKRDRRGHPRAAGRRARHGRQPPRPLGSSRRTRPRLASLPGVWATSGPTRATPEESSLARSLCCE